MSKFAAFIPARGGSKSIKLKNIRELCGRPMIYWTLDAAVSCEEIERVYVATDSEEIAAAVRAYGNGKVEAIGRSAETATDKASTESAMLEFAANRDFGHIVLIQATSPLLEARYLDEGIRLIKEGFDSALSVTRQKRFVWETREDGAARPLNYDPLRRPMRQDFDGFLAENGAFYITSRKALLETGCRLSGKIGVVETPEDMYFEVDEPSDWEIVEGLLKKRMNHPGASRRPSEGGEFFKEVSRRPSEGGEFFKGIKAVFTDCDGVLTDGGMYYTEAGDELKKFNAKDGMGFELLREAGILTGIVTGEDRGLVRRRAAKLKIDEVHIGVKDKLAVMERILAKRGLEFKEIAYIGDDVNDLPVLKRVGAACCPSDAADAVKAVCVFQTRAKGGDGALREVAEEALKSR